MLGSLDPLARLHRAPLRYAVMSGVLYFFIASITIAATSDGFNHAAIWLADAILLAALLHLPRRAWSWILLAGIVANQLANDVTRGFDAAHVMYGVINAGQVLIAATLIRMGPSKNLISDLPSLGRFLLAAGLIAPAIGAVLGSLVSWWLYDQPIVPSSIRWFASNSLGLVVATPFVKGALDGSLKASLQQQSNSQKRNMAGALLIFTLVVHVTFSQPQLPLLFLPVCALVMVAIWLGRVGVEIAVLILAAVATGVTINGYGPLNLLGYDDFRMVVFFQVYLGVLLVMGMVVVTIVTARSDAMAQLADREQMLRQLLMHRKDVTMSFDAKGRCTFCGGPTKSLLGLEVDEILGRNIVELAQRVAVPLAMLDAQEYSLSPKAFALEFQLSNSCKTWVEGSMTPIVIDECLTSSVVTLRDITSQRLKSDDLQRRAHTDELTQTLNRAGFERRVERALTDTGPVTLALIDVDELKRLNDTYGHASGDEALVVVAEIIAAHVRDGDAVGRIGGDEFAVLFRGGADAALVACRRICSCVSDTEIFATDRRLMHVTVSCGVAELTRAESRRDLFEAADRALYEVKRQGRNGARQAA